MSISAAVLVNGIATKRAGAGVTASIVAVGQQGQSRHLSQVDTRALGFGSQQQPLPVHNAHAFVEEPQASVLGMPRRPLLGAPGRVIEGSPGLGPARNAALFHPDDADASASLVESDVVEELQRRERQTYHMVGQRFLPKSSPAGTRGMRLNRLGEPSKLNTRVRFPVPAPARTAAHGGLAAPDRGPVWIGRS